MSEVNPNSESPRSGGVDAHLHGSPPIEDVARLKGVIEHVALAGYLLAGAGVMLGVIGVLKRHEAACPNGKTWGNDEKNYRCYVHPHAFDGTGLIIISLMLVIIIGLVAFVARRSVDGEVS